MFNCLRTGWCQQYDDSQTYCEFHQRLEDECEQLVRAPSWQPSRKLAREMFGASAVDANAVWNCGECGFDNRRWAAKCARCSSTEAPIRFDGEGADAVARADLGVGEEARIEAVLKSDGIAGSLEPDYEAAISDIAYALDIPVMPVRQAAIAGRQGRRIQRTPHAGANLWATLKDAQENSVS